MVNNWKQSAKSLVENHGKISKNCKHSSKIWKITLDLSSMREKVVFMRVVIKLKESVEKLEKSANNLKKV